MSVYGLCSYLRNFWPRLCAEFSGAGWMWLLGHGIKNHRISGGGKLTAGVVVINWVIFLQLLG